MMPTTAETSTIVVTTGLSATSGKNGHGKPKEAVGPHLEQDAGQDHAARGGRLNVRVGEPGVEREHRHFDREGQGEGREEPGSQGSQLWRVLQQVGVGERNRSGALGHLPYHDQDRHEHEERAEEGVDEELDGRVEPVLPAPDPDDEVHRDQHHFPEHVENEEIEREEYPEHARRQE